MDKNTMLIIDLLGWEVSIKAKTLSKRKILPNEIPFGYFKIHPIDTHIVRNSFDILMRVINKIEENKKVSFRLTKFSAGFFRINTKEGILTEPINLYAIQDETKKEKIVFNAIIDIIQKKTI